MNGFEQTNVRLPRDIKSWLKRQAKKHHRSLSAEVAYRLEQSRRDQLRRERRSRKDELS